MIDRSIPLIDLHRHLDGNVRLETILDLGRRHGLSLPAWDVESLRRHTQITEPQPGVMAFIARFQWMTGVMVDPDACRRIAYENVEDARREEIDYIELRFSPWFMAEPHRLDPADVVEAVLDGVSAGARDFGMRVNIIGILSRTYGPEIAWRELEVLMRHRDRIVALDLAGDEVRRPAPLFAGHFRRARDAGWQVTVHAGEAAGPESVWQSIRELGATRIGHAVRAAEDPALLDYMHEHRIGIEANLTSNVQTSTVPDYASHPLRSFLERGLLATLNTDDPGISGIDLAHEYRVAAPAAGLAPGQIRQAQRNALEIAFLSPRERDALARARRGDRPPAPSLTPCIREGVMEQRQTETATLAGGCFWCMEAVFERLDGVERVVSGYAGGSIPDPAYQQVCTGTTGHAEVIQIDFDPKVVSYRELLEIFFAFHDPTTPDRQGPDVGTQYRSAIFCHSPEQKTVAGQVIAELTRARVWGEPIVTEVAAFEAWYPAERHHQGYYRQNAGQPYCQAMIAPKLAKLRKQYLSRLKR
jgi:adenosine deaminase